MRKFLYAYSYFFLRIQRIRGKFFSAYEEVLNIFGEYAEYGEHAKSLSAYSLTTPRDIKVCIS
jgi:hypothetical protein